MLSVESVKSVVEVPDPFPPRNPGDKRKTPPPISRGAYDEWMQHAPAPAAHSIRNGSGFWKVTAGNVVSLVVMIATVLYAAGRVNERIDGLTSWKQSIDDTIKRIDASGTQGGNASLRLVEQKNVEQDRRLNDMQSDMSKIIPDLRELKTKLDDAILLLQDGKNGKLSNR